MFWEFLTVGLPRGYLQTEFCIRNVTEDPQHMQSSCSGKSCITEVSHLTKSLLYYVCVDVHVFVLCRKEMKAQKEKSMSPNKTNI
jgi:hypothetical protein